MFWRETVWQVFNLPIERRSVSSFECWLVATPSARLSQSWPREV